MAELPKFPSEPPSMGDLLSHGLNNIQPAQFELDCRLKHNELTISYERARANAWEARCRKAVECLNDLARAIEGDDFADALEYIGHSLTAIGPLPQEGEKL